jgi:GNAT superfamily N-acetyltransferase
MTRPWVPFPSTIRLMQIPDGYTPIPQGKIASVVTYLEMREPPRSGPVGNPEWSLRLREIPDLNWYRTLFRAVGEKWLWFSRLQMTDDELRTNIHHPAVDVFSFEIGDQEKGILELDRREMPDIEVAFIGLTGDVIGHGAGRYLLGRALELAWSHQPRRVLVHTCTLDHPRALSFYQAAGFIPYKRAIEVADDPRLDGTLSRTAAPQIPLLTDAAHRI